MFSIRPLRGVHPVDQGVQFLRAHLDVQPEAVLLHLELGDT